MRPHDLAAAEGTPLASAVLLHPHPDMGGDRFNNVVSELYHALPPAGITVIRFDFSSSTGDTAAAETSEALDELPVDVPRFLAGYSFGGGVAATITDERVAGWFLAAPALSMTDPAIGDDPRPKLIVAGQHDRLFPPEQLEATTVTWQNVEYTVVGGADHFFVGRTDVVAARCVEWIKQVAR
jgi:alpha/beta superfamily hydrolase